MWKVGLALVAGGALWLLFRPETDAEKRPGRGASPTSADKSEAIRDAAANGSTVRSRLRAGTIRRITS